MRTKAPDRNKIREKIIHIRLTEDDYNLLQKFAKIIQQLTMYNVQSLITST